MPDGELESQVDDNPDYCGPEGNKLRAEANAYGDERHRLLDAANAAYEAGEKGKAKELSEQGKEAGKRMEEMHKKAAAVILKHRNDGHPITYLDLHGLLLAEAITAFKERVELLQKKSQTETNGVECIFEVIPGAGHHSKGKAVIKPKIMEELDTMKLPYTHKNEGTLLVTIKAGTPAPPATADADNPVTSSYPPEPPVAEKPESSTAEGTPTPTDDVQKEMAISEPVNDSHGCCIIM